jgi:hypothetical protein
MKNSCTALAWFIEKSGGNAGDGRLRLLVISSSPESTDSMSHTTWRTVEIATFSLLLFSEAYIFLFATSVYPSMGWNGRMHLNLKMHVIVSWMGKGDRPEKGQTVTMNDSEIEREAFCRFGRRLRWRGFPIILSHSWLSFEMRENNGRTIGQWNATRTYIYSTRFQGGIILVKTNTTKERNLAEIIGWEAINWTIEYR